MLTRICAEETMNLSTRNARRRSEGNRGTYSKVVAGVPYRPLPRDPIDIDSGKVKYPTSTQVLSNTPQAFLYNGIFT
jgi:hypothetical protein